MNTLNVTQETFEKFYGTLSMPAVLFDRQGTLIKPKLSDY
jgi:hypothetical protein